MTIQASSITLNSTTTNKGGGIYISSTGTDAVSIINSTISSNEANGGAGGGWDGSTTSIPEEKPHKNKQQSTRKRTISRKNQAQILGEEYSYFDRRGSSSSIKKASAPFSSTYPFLRVV